MDEKKHFLTDRNKILIKKDHSNTIYFMSRYSDTENTVTRYIEGNELSYFLSKDLPLEDWNSKGRLFAQSWDNHAPWIFEKHGILGANHGSFYTFKISMLRHWLFEADIGKSLTDDEGNRFILLSIENLSTFYIHSEIPEEGEFFCDHVTGSLHIDGKTIIPESVTRWMMNGVPGGQISPHQRYNKITLLAKGKEEIAQGEIKECAYAELSVDMDLIFPDELIRYLKKNPGKYVAPNASIFDGAIKCEMTTFFQPGSCRRIRNKVTFLKDIPEAFHYGMIQYYSEIPFSLHEKMVPGFRKFTEKDLETDLNTLWSFPCGKGYVRRLKKEDAANPERLPNICIDQFGNEGKRLLGVSLSYSSSCGITARGNEKERGDILLYLYQSGKIYPYACEKSSAKEGESFTLHAFHQYFLPAENGASIFHRQEEDGYYIYAVFPGKTPYISLVLPENIQKKSFAVFEEGDGVSFEKANDNTMIFHAEKPSYIILKEEK